MKSEEDDTVPESSKKCLTDVRRTSDIITDASAIIDASRKFAYRTVNMALIQRNWLLGKRIAEEELLGGKKENYGLEVIQNLSRELTKRYGKGYSESNLYNFVQFHRMFPGILQSLIAESPVLSWTHYSVLNDKDQLFSAKYLLCLPKEEDLRAEIEAQKTIYYAEHRSNDSASGTSAVRPRRPAGGGPPARAFPAPPKYVRLLRRSMARATASGAVTP